jgi:diguanylate cyclase (GGDEF)-like protein
LLALHKLVETSAREVEFMNQELANLAAKDSLTDLANRRRFDEHLLRELERLTRHTRPLSLIMLDVDHFKGFNDTYGHVGGDDCLRGISQVLHTTPKRPGDLLARYGGEEFACILPETAFSGAVAFASELRKGIEELAIPNSASLVSDVVTVSIGVVTVACSRGLKPEMIVELCDQQLYRSKQEGRNRVSGTDLLEGQVQDAAPCSAA